MDPVVAAGMIFSVVVLMLIGGFILLYPITRQLGTYLERRMLADDDPGRFEEHLHALVREVEGLRDEVDRIAEKQEFTERLLERPAKRAEPPE